MTKKVLYAVVLKADTKALQEAFEQRVKELPHVVELKLYADGQGTAKRLGVKQAIKVLMDWKCKDCKQRTCSECLYLEKALDTSDTYDCRLMKMLTDERAAEKGL